jgi:hypothetical protein
VDSPEDTAPILPPLSPFIAGRPLRADEPFFGRDDLLGWIGQDLATDQPVNLVGERRIGKTSLLNHLVGNQERHLAARPDGLPLVLFRIDLQDTIPNAARFYGAALCGLLAALPPSRSAEARALEERRRQFAAVPEPAANHGEFRQVLEQVTAPGGLQVRPVLLIDEWECILAEAARVGFPRPDFFRHLRSLVSAGLLTLVVASR